MVCLDALDSEKRRQALNLCSSQCVLFLVEQSSCSSVPMYNAVQQYPNGIALNNCNRYSDSLHDSGEAGTNTINTPVVDRIITCRTDTPGIFDYSGATELRKQY